MADDGKLLGSVQILTDELVRIINGIKYVYTPGVGEKWYYKLTNVLSHSSTGAADLIAGNYLQDATGSASTVAQSTVDPADLIKFLFVKNLGIEADATPITGSIYLSLDAQASADPQEAQGDLIEVGVDEAIAMKMKCTVANLHCN